MKFAVIGGDLRSALLCSMLAGDGHRVYSFALEKAELPPEGRRPAAFRAAHTARTA